MSFISDLCLAECGSVVSFLLRSYILLSSLHFKYFQIFVYFLVLVLIMANDDQRVFIMRVIMNRHDTLKKYAGRERDCLAEWASITEEVKNNCPGYNSGRVRTLFIRWVSDFRVSIHFDIVVRSCFRFLKSEKQIFLGYADRKFGYANRCVDSY